MTPGHVESDLMELGVNACCGSGTLPDQHGSVPKEDGLFALLDGLGMDLRDEAARRMRARRSASTSSRL
jgi:hypothetical protein